MRIAVLVAALCISVVSAQACSIFTVVRDGKVLFGSNEDYIKRGVVWFVPGDGTRLGRVNVGFEDDFAQGSMNEKGLAFDSATVSPVPWSADPSKPTSDNLIELVMNECGTVEEAIRYFEEQNCKHLSGGQFMFADASGDSVVIAWLPEKGLSIDRISGDYHIVTNTRLNMSGYRCARFTRAEQILNERKDGSLETMTAVMDAIHQYGPGAFTTYSCVYDLKERRIHLYNLSNFEESVTFSLDAELAKGKKTHSMRRLFKDSPALDTLTTMEQRAEFGTRIELNAEVLKRYEGNYAPEAAPDVRVRVIVDGSELRVQNQGQPDAVLFPESETRFRIAPDRGTVSFEVDEGTVQAMVLHRGTDMRALRVD